MEKSSLAPEVARFLARGGAVRMLADIDEGQLHTLYRYARQCIKQGEIAVAERLLQSLFYLDAWNFDYALSLGLCMQMRGAHDEALFCLARAAQVRSADPRPPYYAALSYQKTGNVEYAQRAFRSVLRLAVESSPYRELRRHAKTGLQRLEQGDSV